MLDGMASLQARLRNSYKAILLVLLLCGTSTSRLCFAWPYFFYISFLRSLYFVLYLPQFSISLLRVDSDAPQLSKANAAHGGA